MEFYLRGRGFNPSSLFLSEKQMNEENILSIATRGIFKFKIVQGGKSIINTYVLFNLRPTELSMMQYQDCWSIND